ncbi:MAG: hypothetical protein Q9159_002914 [Coniocarpon cinnabarinum]
MASRKRRHEQISNDARPTTPVEPPSLLKRIRNAWQFACLMQFIQFFGSALKIDNELDVDMLEEECLKPNSEKLANLALTLLKWVSSHRGLTLDIFDEYTRRQYLAKAPHLNPFGEEEDALKFSEMDILTKLKVLHQLSVWTLHNPDRIRERMSESTDKEQVQWRLEPFGDDRDGRHYYLLDDNRLYRMTDPPAAKPPTKKVKAKPKPKTPGSRASKRQKIISDTEADEEANDENGKDDEQTDDSLGGANWECVAVTLDEYRGIIDKFRKSKNADEKDMVMVLEDQAMPELLKAEESKARKEQKRQRDLENLQKMATAKRSSRLADKQEKQRQEDEAKATELRRQQELDMAHKEQERQMKAEKDRESRMMTREQRIRDREMRRILHEEELSKLQERSQSVDSSEAARMSERTRTNMLEKKQKDLERLKEEEQDDWEFDCEICGVHGTNVDDGSHSVACDKCGVWQHSKCNKITPQQADQDDFKFVCLRCQKPKTNIKLKLKNEASPAEEVNQPITAKPAVQVSQGTSSSSPPMGVFKPTPAAPTAKPLYVNGIGQLPPSPSKPPPLVNPYTNPPQMPNGHVKKQSHSTGTNGPLHNLQAPPQMFNPYPSQQHHPQTRESPASSQPRPTSSSSSNMPNGAYTSHTPPQQPPHYSQATQPPMTNGITPSHQSTFTSPPHHAPMPSLSATQGNTSLRFSPAAQPPPSPSRHLGSTNLANSPGAAHAYSPNTAKPQLSAASPVKHASPPSSFVSNPASSLSNTAGPPGSPTKANLQLPPQTQTPGHAHPMGLDGAVPTLSPSVNAHASNAVPTKKPTPVKGPSFLGSPPQPIGMAQMNGSLGQQQDVSMVNGVVDRNDRPAQNPQGS